MSDKTQENRTHVHNHDNNSQRLREVKRRVTNKESDGDHRVIEVQPATEENRQASDTKMSLKDFAKEANKKNPNMEKLTGWLKENNFFAMDDAKKAEFLQTIFPSADKNVGEFKALGFENTKRLRNTVAAMQQLHSEGAISDAQMKEFLLSQNPKNGQNVLTSVALNLRAAEFKYENMTDPDALNKLEKSIGELKKTLAQIGKTDKSILAEVVPARDNFEVKGKHKGHSFAHLFNYLSDETKSSPEFANFVFNQEEQATAANANTNTGATPQGNTFAVGGSANNGNLTVGNGGNGSLTIGAPNTANPSVNVNPQEATADIMPNGEDKKKRKDNDFKFTPVKEEDIIKYMFEHWFLASLNWIMEKACKIADKMIDVLCETYDAAPTSARVGELPRNTEGIKFMNNALDASTLSLHDGINRQSAYYRNLAETVRNNIGRPANQWQIPQVDGRPILDMARPNDVAFINRMNQQYSANPDEFMLRLEASQVQLNNEMGYINSFIRLSSGIANAQYLAQHPNGPFDNNATAAITRTAEDNFRQLIKQAEQIRQLTEIEYRIANNMTPNAQLSDNDMKEINKSSAQRLGTYMKNAAQAAHKVRDNVNAYYNAPSQNVQQKCLSDINSSAATLNTAFSDAGLATVCTPRPNVQLNQVSILQATNNNNDERIQMFGDAINASGQHIAELYQQSRARLNPFKRMKDNRFIKQYENLFGRGGRP